VARAEAYLPPFGHNRHGPKTGAAVSLWAGGAWSPSNTLCPGPRPTSLPSGIFIHAAVWSQQTWTKNWGRELSSFVGGGAGSPSNTMWPLAQSYLNTKCILIHIQPFSHNGLGPRIIRTQAKPAPEKFECGRTAVHSSQSTAFYLRAGWG